jgi:peptidoglycan-associated lipoprotein
MKLTHFSNLLIIAIALSFSTLGCKTSKKGNTPLPGGGSGLGQRAPGEGEALRPGETVDGTSGFGGGTAATFNPDDYNQDRAALASYAVHFDYDSSAIRSSDQSSIDAVAAALSSDASAKLLIEGHCDERGTEEYNRSLGERRALAAREALAARGVDAGRIATRSYGEDRPADPGHDEPAWSANRRDEFILLHPK